MQRSALAFFLVLPISGWSQVMAGAQSAHSPSSPPTVPPDQRCVVAGRVTNALTGEPVRKATVRLTPSRGGTGSMGGVIMTAGNMLPGGQGYSTSTDADGGFRIEGVNPGRYSIWVNRSGFLNTTYGARKPNQPGSAITLGPGQQLTDIAVPVTPQAVIAGKVVDADGDPVSGGVVQVLTPTWTRGKLRYYPRGGGGQINDLGEYRIANLSPGKYYLFAQIQNNMPDGNIVTSKPDVRPVRTYYPSSIAFSGATPIDVTAGQDVSGIEIRLQSVQTYHIRGHVSGLTSDKGQERTMINLTPRDDEMVTFGGGRSNLRPDGSFDLAGVAPGAYYLSMFNMSGQIRTVARQAVDVGAGDVDGVVLTITPPGSIRGVARLEGTPPAGGPQISASNLHLTLMPTEMVFTFGPPASAKFSADGTFSIENVSPGKFYVQTSAPPGTYLKSVRFGNSEILGKELDLSGGAAGQLELVYRYGPGEIDGQLDPAQTGAANSGIVAQIAVVPEELNADGSGAHFSATDAKGTFSVANLPPGRYRAYAFEEVNFGALQNPDLLKQLESKSPVFEVKENEKKQVQLSLIPRDELEQIYARVGVQPQ